MIWITLITIIITNSNYLGGAVKYTKVLTKIKHANFEILEIDDYNSTPAPAPPTTLPLP